MNEKLSFIEEMNACRNDICTGNECTGTVIGNRSGWIEKKCADIKTTACRKDYIQLEINVEEQSLATEMDGLRRSALILGLNHVRMIIHNWK